MIDSTIGIHVTRQWCKSGSTIEQNIQEAEKKLDIRGMKCCQIFVATPQGWHFSISSDAQEKSLKTFIERTGMHIYSHARYIDNLFSSTVKPGTLGFIKKELKICQNVGIIGFVVHLYRYPPHCVVENIEKLDPPKDVKIMLETPAINPSKAIYNSADALIELYGMTKKAKLNCGICIDTCHIFVSGENITEVLVMSEFFNQIIKGIPPEDILIHLNDSAAGLGTGRDRHATLGDGLIWGKNQDSLKWLLEFIKKYKIDTVLERSDKNGDLERDIKMIDKLFES